MPSEKNSKVATPENEATHKTPTPQQNLLLFLKLVVGGAVLVLVIWYLDSHLSK